MNGQNKPNARQKRVVGAGKGIEKKGEGLGIGPVGQMPGQSAFEHVAKDAAKDAAAFVAKEAVHHAAQKAQGGTQNARASASRPAAGGFFDQAQQAAQKASRPSQGASRPSASRPATGSTRPSAGRDPELRTEPPGRCSRGHGTGRMQRKAVSDCDCGDRFLRAGRKEPAVRRGRQQRKQQRYQPDNDEFAEIGHFVDTELRVRFGNFVRVGFDRVFQQREQRIHHEPAEQLSWQHGQQLCL